MFGLTEKNKAKQKFSKSDYRNEVRAKKTFKNTIISKSSNSLIYIDMNFDPESEDIFASMTLI
jgi:hypothetical protein